MVMSKVTPSASSSLYPSIEAAILETCIEQKCRAAFELYNSFDSFQIETELSAVQSIKVPGAPSDLELVPPRMLKKRGIQSQTGRNALMHAIAHIEFNAINLALDAAYRFRNQPIEFIQDWLSVAADEARHFQLIQRYLLENDSFYGAMPVHNGLWEMAVDTAHDVTARMALVPRVLEARGLDVTPSMIKRLNSVGDSVAVAILNTIYEDEIGHVAIGSKWFYYQCQQQKLEPRKTFIELVKTHLHGELKGPFNISARLLAGFDEQELQNLENLNN